MKKNKFLVFGTWITSFSNATCYGYTKNKNKNTAIRLKNIPSRFPPTLRNVHKSTLNYIHQKNSQTEVFNS